MTSQNDEAELVWCSRRGWVLRAPARLADSALLALCKYAIDSQTAAFLAMKPTDPKKKLLEFAIGELQKVRITQEIR